MKSIYASEVFKSSGLTAWKDIWIQPFSFEHIVSCSFTPYSTLHALVLTGFNSSHVVAFNSTVDWSGLWRWRWEAWLCNLIIIGGLLCLGFPWPLPQPAGSQAKAQRVGERVHLQPPYFLLHPQLPEKFLPGLAGLPRVLLRPRDPQEVRGDVAWCSLIPRKSKTKPWPCQHPFNQAEMLYWEDGLVRCGILGACPWIEMNWQPFSCVPAELTTGACINCVFCRPAFKEGLKKQQQQQQKKTKLSASLFSFPECHSWTLIYLTSEARTES